MAEIYFASSNPFNLPKPPAWWLRLIADYDKQLVIFPSEKDRVYRLCRKVRREARLGLDAMKPLHSHPDTRIAIRLGAVPITTVFPWAITSAKILRDLRRRDLWAHGKTPDELIKSMEEGEQREQERQARRDSQELDHVSGEAFRSLKIRTGQAVFSNDKHRGRQGRPADPKAVKFAISDHKSVISRPSPKGSTRGGIVITDA